MEDVIIVVIIAVLVLTGILSARKHFRGKGGCCGGGGSYISRKKLKHVIARKTYIVEGMTCDHCKARVTRAINDMDGLAATVHLKKKEVRVSMERQVCDDAVKEAIEKAGYQVVGVR